MSICTRPPFYTCHLLKGLRLEDIAASGQFGAEVIT